MASFQILKSGLYPFPASQSYSRRSIRPDTTRIINFGSINTRFLVSCKVQDNDNDESKGTGEEPTESLFMKELRQRGMTPTSLLEETSKDENTTLKEEDGGFLSRDSVSKDLEKSLFNQREQSMALNSEGLEGLIPRAKLLVTLGGSYFLAFWPVILVTMASFSAVYFFLGPRFVHDANTRQVYTASYVNPYALLEDQRPSQTAPNLN